MSKPILVIWLQNADPYIQAIEQEGFGDSVEVFTLSPEEQPDAQLLARMEALIAWKVPEPMIEQMPKLRWIQTLSVAVDSWLGREDMRDDIVLTCARGVHDVQMPESIIGSLLYLTRGFDVLLEQQKQHVWERRPPQPINGKTLGILGLGTVGQAVARKLEPFGMRIIGTKNSPRDLPGIDQVYGPEETDTVLEQSDFVLLQLPVTPQTENLMNMDRFRKMKPTAYLLNFARGQIIVDDDLIQALKTNEIQGAVLDVFRQEPLPADHPFWDVPGLKIFPHIGGMHPQRDKIVSALFIKNLRAFLNNETQTAVVDFAVGY
ncbi:MAG: D-2-hydroxyacid dehydrogenase [Methyloligellaceae bacterium]